MNRQFLIPFLLLAVACGGGSTEPPASSPSAPPATTMAAPSPMGPTLEAEVVTMDPAAPSVTLREGDVPATRSPRPKDLKVGDRTIRVEPAATASLSGLKPGMRVRVTCSAPAAVVVEGSPAMGAASPGTTASGARMASTMPRAATEAGGRLLPQCDSIVAITPLEAAPAP
jgi:hypothetical protein